MLSYRPLLELGAISFHGRYPDQIGVLVRTRSPNVRYFRISLTAMADGRSMQMNQTVDRWAIRETDAESAACFNGTSKGLCEPHGRAFFEVEDVRALRIVALTVEALPSPIASAIFVNPEAIKQ
jgi:hypothetical protein